MKVIRANANSFAVVEDAYGDILAQGMRLLPFCRVPIGPGRNAAQAQELAEEIARLLDGNSDDPTPCHEQDDKDGDLGEECDPMFSPPENDHPPRSRALKEGGS